MTPSVGITKQDGNTGVVRPSTTGVLAIIAAAAIGTQNQPGTFTRQADVLTTSGLGPLVDLAAYFMNTAGKPVLTLRPITSTAAAYGAVSQTGTGTCVITAGAAAPLDDYNVLVKWITGGTIGVAGITYTYSLDGGVTTSAVQALGTANSITLNAPRVGTSAGVQFSLAAGTLVAGDSFVCATSRAQMTNGDLVTALEALRVSAAPWDAVLIDGSCSATTVATVDAWLAGLEAVGIYKKAYMNTRRKTAGESEATYLTAMAALLASTSSTRIDVGTDGGDLPSAVTGLLQPRPTSLAVATRKLKFPIGVDPAYVANGPIPGFQIADSNNNPKWHNEALYPGLDALRFTTLTTINGQQGVFITNANLLSPAGSDYVYDQHADVMNAACTIVYAMLTTELSKGVRKQAPNPTTGLIYILEQDAAAIEAVINAALAQQLKGQVNSVAFQLSRTDDLSSNAGATVNGEIQVQALAYIKKFNITAKFVRSISVTP